MASCSSACVAGFIGSYNNGLPKLSEESVPLFPLDPVLLLTQKGC